MAEARKFEIVNLTSLLERFKRTSDFFRTSGADITKIFLTNMTTKTKRRETKEELRGMTVANLEPLKRNLDRIESECIYRVIEKTTNRVKEVQMLYEIISDDALIFSLRDVDLRELVLTHQNLVNRYMPGDRKKFKELADSLKDIFKFMERRQISLTSCMKNNIKPKYSQFLEMLVELRIITRDKLLQKQQKKTLVRDILLQSMEKARNSQQLINSLNETLTAKIQEKDHVLNEKDRVIRQMKHELDKMTATADAGNNTTLNDAAKQILTDNKSLENKQAKLNEEVIDLKERLQKIRSSNYATESRLRKRKFKMAGELHNWIVKYDQDMSWRQDQIEEITRLNEQDLAEIQELENQFVAVQKEYDEIMEERRTKKEKQLKKEEEEKMKKKATVKIQSMWRGYQTRTEIKGKTNKKNNKKGKGKGKKGGKKK